MNEALKFGQLVFWALTIIVGFATAWKGIRELRLNTESRDREIPWKAALTAKHVSGGESGGLIEISTDEIRAALRQPRRPAMPEKDVFIRDCFDWFFYYVDRLEHYAGAATFHPFAATHEYRNAIRFFALTG